MSTRLSSDRGGYTHSDSSSEGGTTIASPVPPQPPTLRKYGLTAETWLAIVKRQSGICPVCERDLVGLTLHIDHEHVRGWKKMTPEERRPYVRGVLCAHCNLRFVPTRLDAARALRVAKYLKRYELFGSQLNSLETEATDEPRAGRAART